MQNSNIKVYDLTTFTLLDFPDTPAAIIWLAGCNMRCAYCHNPDIVFGKNELSFDEVLKFLKKRKRVLEGVVLSGGEPTLHKDIVNIAKEIKSLGYKIKLDTNGSRFEVLKKLLDENLLDYVALDFKAPKEKFVDITNSDSYESLIKSIKILKDKDIEFEVRTTVHTDMLNEDDIEKIVKSLKEVGFNRNFYIQNYKNSGKTLKELQDQKKVLDTKRFKEPFIKFRNFETENVF